MSPKIFLVFGLGIAIALAIRFYAGPDPDGFTPMQRDVANELPNFGYGDIDVSTLTSEQISEIATLLRSSRGTAEIRGLIGAVLNRGS